MVAVGRGCVNPPTGPVLLWSNLLDTRMLCKNYLSGHW
jgi:hypothetical protein